MLNILFVIPSITIILITLFWTYNSKFKNPFMLKFATHFPKLLTLVSLNLNLLYSSYLWKIYPVNYRYPWWQFYEHYNAPYPSNWIDVDRLILFQATNSLNLPFIILSTFVLIISLLTAWNSNVNMLLLCTILLLIEICLIGSFSCTNIFVFLLFFEASALPIFVLITYCGSARRERLKASYYFLFFTLYGSLSLLLLILAYYSSSQISFFSVTQDVSSNHALWH